MYYAAGIGTVTAFAAASQLPHAGAFWLLSRVLLDLAGGLFLIYLALVVGLLLIGHVLRFRDRGNVT